MLERMKWEETYELWKTGGYYISESLSSPVSAETVFVEYKQSGYFYGYDWLKNTDVHERKQLIDKNPMGFLYFTSPSNKGTIQTAEMLVEAKNEEEIAAIWMAATAKELSKYGSRNGVVRYADMIYYAACEFLKSRFYLWHHAMTSLVPEIIIPTFVLENVVCKDAEPVIGLIQMNTVLLKNTWSILRYSSLKNEELPESSCRICSK